MMTALFTLETPPISHNTFQMVQFVSPISECHRCILSITAIGDWSEISRLSKPSKKGAPFLIIVTPSAKRAVDLIRFTVNSFEKIVTG
jgi:hypothetical protein